MRRDNPFRVALAFAVLGMLLTVLGAALVASRASTERAAVDRTIATTAGEKAALVDTELERARALTLLTARIPPFSEFYADAGSQAAAIAAVAGPGREINNALSYLAQRYPDRVVEAGYVDVSGHEDARVLHGQPVPASSLLADVHSWPSYQQGIRTPVGEALVSQPFVSPTAGVEVVAATTTVSVDGRVRAYIELELSVTAIQRVLTSDVDHHTSVAVVDGTGRTITAVGPSLPALIKDPKPGLGTVNRLRLATRQVPSTGGVNGAWYVVAAAAPRSAASFAIAPLQAAVLLIAVVLLVLAGVAFRRARAVVAEQLRHEQHARAEAERRSRVDPLTDLYNRRHAMEILDHELARSAREGTGVGVLMFDIDRFKKINDSQGHAGGDAAIVEVARRLRLAVRSWDAVARMGGEEFCVIAPGMSSEEDVAELGERLRVVIAERAVALPRGLALPVTVSVGAMLAQPGELTPERSVDSADRALYAAKRRGRNRLCRFSELGHDDLTAEQPDCLTTAQALAATSDLRRNVVSDRSRRVEELAVRIGERLGLSQEEMLVLRLGGWLYDLGMGAVPDSILLKAGPLTPQEWEAVRRHPAVGADLLEGFPELAAAVPCVRHHHERYDGAGYPDGLVGEQIPIAARIVAVADAFTAMISDRPHAARRSSVEATEELRRGAGTQFDPRVVGALIDELDARARGERRRLRARAAEG